MLNGNRSTLKALLFVILVLAFLGVVASGPTWAAPPEQAGTVPPGPPGPPGPGGGGDACRIGPGGADCDSPRRDFHVHLRPVFGHLGGIIRIVLRELFPIPVTGASVRVATSSYVMVGHTWQLEVASSDETPVTGDLPDPADITVTYTPEEITAAGVNENSLVVMLYDPATGVWSLLTTVSIDPVAHTILAQTVSLPPNATFALFGQPSVP